MTTIRRCLTLDQALTIKSQLESIGIAAFIPDEMSAGFAPHHFFTESGVRVQVEDDKANEAKEFLGGGEEENNPGQSS
jgi:hypothetical protein